MSRSLADLGAVPFGTEMIGSLPSSRFDRQERDETQITLRRLAVRWTSVRYHQCRHCRPCHFNDATRMKQRGVRPTVAVSSCTPFSHNVPLPYHCSVCFSAWRFPSRITEPPLREGPHRHLWGQSPLPSTQKGTATKCCTMWELCIRYYDQ